MKQFANIFNVLSVHELKNFNFRLLAFKRKAVLESQGVDVTCINWELFVKILEAKYEQLKNS